ncbi:hypothetical protein PCCS19_57210 [Paenibacillus sp. CCS19]|nr:hypothetical protein PCCS19_57210 [Paenibacillus cellulosilyticus]
MELLKDYKPVPLAADAKVKVVFDYKPNPSEIYIREFDPNSGAYISERKLDSGSFALWTISSRGGPRFYAIDARWGVDGNGVAAQATYYFQAAIEGIADGSSGSEINEISSAVREAAWNDLSPESAEVQEAGLSEMPIVKGGGEPPKAEQLYKVTFKTNKDALLGPIVVYVDGDTGEVLGYGLRM